MKKEAIPADFVYDTVAVPLQDARSPDCRNIFPYRRIFSKNLSVLFPSLNHFPSLLFILRGGNTFHYGFFFCNSLLSRKLQ